MFVSMLLFETARLEYLLELDGLGSAESTDGDEDVDLE